ncbi:MAG: replicative DNA helicase [Eubacterium sp.]|nr:replicative DNA helicase [Eubacterium sp.]
MEEAVVKRIMPHSNEAEQAVIGSMLMDVDAIPVAMEKLSDEDFYNRQYGSLFKAMVDLYNEGKTCDLITVKDKLVEMEVPSEVISIDFIKNILEMVPTSANIKQYSEIVYEKAVLRNLIKANDEIANECYAGKEKLEAVLEHTEKKIFDLIQTGNTGDYVPVRQVVLNVFEKIEQASHTRGSITGLPTGFTRLDHQLSGLQPSDMILIAARPSVGKTAFVLNITENVAIKHNHAVAIFSLEMSSEQLINRVLAQNSMVSSQKIRVGDLTDNEWANIVESANIIGNSNIIIDDTPGISIGEMRSKCRKFKLEKDIKLVIVDYLQLMTTNGRSSSREQEIAEISRTLKGIARELNVPVIALSQLNRASETREDKKPIMADLRESGSIEQDADVVMLLSRYYDKETKTEDRNRIIVNVAKQRNGPVGEVELVWLPQYTKFENKEVVEGEE